MFIFCFSIVVFFKGYILLVSVALDEFTWCFEKLSSSHG